MKEFKIRCSQIGKIMGRSGLTDKQSELLKELENKEKLTAKQKETYNDLVFKKNNPELPATCISYLEDWYKEQLYQRRKEFSNKYTEKGNINEDESIDFISDELNLPFISKNQQFFSNEYIEGIPDIILPDEIIDVKNSWDCFTFPLLEKELPTKDYWWQGQGYMELVGREKYRVCYVLTNTPYHLIEREARTWCFKNGYDELDDDILQDFMDKMTYDNITNNLKLKYFSFNKDNQAIRQIEQRVIECRNYINKNFKTQWK